MAKILSSKWAAKVLEQLHFASRPLRFTELHAALESSGKELSRQLAALEQHELIERHSYGSKAPFHVEYTLTPAGDALLEVLEQLAWRSKGTEV